MGQLRHRPECWPLATNNEEGGFEHWGDCPNRPMLLLSGMHAGTSLLQEQGWAVQVDTQHISEPCRDRKPLEPKTSCYVSLQNHIPFFSAVSQAPTGNVLATEGDSTTPRISEEGKKQCFDPQGKRARAPRFSGPLAKPVKHQWSTWSPQWKAP